MKKLLLIALLGASGACHAYKITLANITDTTIKGTVYMTAGGSETSKSFKVTPDSNFEFNTGGSRCLNRIKAHFDGDEDTKTVKQSSVCYPRTITLSKKSNGKVRIK